MTVTTIDADIAANKTVYSTNAVYATARTTSSAIYTTEYRLGQYGTPYQCYRFGLKFDTSSIPDTDDVSAVAMKLAVLNDSSAADFDINIVSCDWSGQDPLDAANREATFDAILAASTEALWRNTSGIGTGTYYTSAALTPARVNKTGYTYYGIISAKDQAATAPTGGEYINFNIVAMKPQLVITHAPAPSSGPQVVYLSDYGII